MKKDLVLLSSVFVLMLNFVGSSLAVVVQVSVETDKEFYQLGEDVVVRVTAFNPNQEPVTLGFASSLTATYLIDDHFDWSVGKVFVPSGRQLTIQPNESFAWDLTHGSKEISSYPLNLGLHSVVGKVVGYGQSETIGFEVVPEPATILVFAPGLIILKRTNSHGTKELSQC
jgi:hypothetical protein